MCYKNRGFTAYRSVDMPGLHKTALRTALALIVALAVTALAPGDAHACKCVPFERDSVLPLPGLRFAI